MSTEKQGSKFIFGIIFIAIGLLWIMSNLGYIHVEIPEYIFSWKSILILIGVIFIINNDHKFPGIVLVLLGSYFLLPDMFPFISHQKMWDLFFPFLLILIGLSLFFKKNRKKKVLTNENKRSTYADDKSYFNTTESQADYSTILSESRRRFTNSQFSGGKVLVLLGQSHLDLTGCSLTTQKNILDINVILGQLVLIIPKEFNLQLDANAILGEIEDFRGADRSAVNLEKTLTISGSVVLGSLKICNA